MLVGIFASVAQADRARILERTNEGRVAAMDRGVKFGRKPSINRKKFKELFVQNLAPKDIIKEMKISRPAYYSIKKELGL
jgi:DNA invertase Pin-like site-specific DNA recombinase